MRENGKGGEGGCSDSQGTMESWVMSATEGGEEWDIQELHISKCSDCKKVWCRGGVRG